MVNPEQFIADLNAKKDTAWKRLYAEFYPALCAYAEKLTKDNLHAEDVVQDCIIALWDASYHFPNLQTLIAYLYKAVYLRTLNLLDSRNHAREHAMQFLNEYASEESDEQAAIDAAIKESAIAKLRLVLDELPSQQRQIMDLCLQNRKVKEIADLLGVSENTIKIQKKRAYAYIRERLGGIWSVLFMMFFSIRD